MEIKPAFGQALKEVRSAKKLTQEDFSEMSSRTYLSSLERGLKSPTLEKIDQLASVLGVHPLTLVLKCYLHKEPSSSLDKLWDRVRSEL